MFQGSLLPQISLLISAADSQAGVPSPYALPAGRTLEAIIHDIKINNVVTALKHVYLYHIQAI